MNTFKMATTVNMYYTIFIFIFSGIYKYMKGARSIAKVEDFNAIDPFLLPASPDCTAN